MQRQSAANLRCLTWHVLRTPWYWADSLFILLPSLAASSANSLTEMTRVRSVGEIETSDDVTRLE